MGEQPLRTERGVPDLPSLLSLATLSALSCCSGDTWASEVGSVAGGKPRLITSWRVVPKGTNGGVTTVGVASSVAGGAVVGLGYTLTLLVFWDGPAFQGVDFSSQLDIVLLGAVSGFFGSMVDSVLGAIFQFSGYSEKMNKVVNVPGSGVSHISGWNLLDNHEVNLLSSLVTALTIPLCWTGWIWFRHY